jgi:4-oxalocrotonate tautomerase family enzyme
MAGVFTAPQKQEIIERLTDAMVAIEGESMRQAVWCIVEEVASGEWGGGGRGANRRRCQSARPELGPIGSLSDEHFDDLRTQAFRGCSLSIVEGQYASRIKNRAFHGPARASL